MTCCARWTGVTGIPSRTASRRCALLRLHWQGEENGIFFVMAAREQQYADYVRPLIAEHRELAQLLASVDVTIVTRAGRTFGSLAVCGIGDRRRRPTWLPVLGGGSRRGGAVPCGGGAVASGVSGIVTLRDPRRGVAVQQIRYVQTPGGLA